ncbi:hypothetical protein ACIRNI_09440 [Streptomyces sp. NPDC093546]|uniref:hypothetical protein n=1 Tax=Streptomyces sp. NPDC093546 TaxID=3366040 RepID=UPI003808C9CF
MHYVSEALEWVRAVLFGRTPSRHSRRYVPSAANQFRPVLMPSPEGWAAVLARARKRRAFNAALPAFPSVRLYVLCPEERERALIARARFSPGLLANLDSVEAGR